MMALPHSSEARGRAGRGGKGRLWPKPAECVARKWPEGRGGQRRREEEHIFSRRRSSEEQEGDGGDKSQLGDDITPRSRFLMKNGM